MLHHGQKFDVGESHLADVFGEARRGLAIGERAVVLFRNAHPRAEMHFVDGMRRAQRVAFGALCHPVRIVPLVVEIPDDRRGARRLLVEKAERIGFVDAVSVMLSIRCEICRARPWSTPGMKPSQMPGGTTRAQSWCVLGSHPLKLPTTETERALGAHTLKTVPGLAVASDEVGSHLVVHAVVAALVEEVEVLIGEELRGGECRISGLMGCAR